MHARRKNLRSQVPASEAVTKFQKKYASSARQEIQIVTTSSAMETPPQKLPTPWLADSEWLLDELAKTREAVLRIHQRLDNASDIKSAIDRIWNLERTLRDLLRMHREGQRSFAEKAEAGQKRSQSKAQKHGKKVIRIQAQFEKDFKEKRSLKTLQKHHPEVLTAEARKWS